MSGSLDDAWKVFYDALVHKGQTFRHALADYEAATSAALTRYEAATTAAEADVTAAAAAFAALLTGQPPVPPPPPPPPVSTRIRSMWRFGWQNIDPANWPADVQQSITHVTTAMCQSAGAGSGRLTMPPSVSRAMVTSLTSRGVDVFAGIGGSGDGGISIATPGQVAEALASIGQMKSSYGITGIVLDLEGGPGSGWNVDSMAALGKACVASGVKVGIWSALYGMRLSAWGAVARALGQDLHHWQRGFYDFPEAGDGRLTGIVLGDLAAMRQYVAREDQLVASFMPRPVSPYPNSSPVPVIIAAYAAVRAKFPLVGWSIWEDSIEAATGWGATRALAKL